MKLDFLGIPPADDPVAAVLPVPHDATSSYGIGARRGPESLLLASRQVETWLPDFGRDLEDWPVRTEEPVEVDLTDLANTVESARLRTAAILKEELFPFVLGGDHSITPGPVAACVEAHGPLTIVQVDAHLDLRDRWQGTPHSHACVMRRCHQDLGCAIVPVGIRSGSEECHAYAADQGIRPLFARDLESRPRSEWLGELGQRLQELDRPVYLTVDLDGLDPSILPDTGTPEPGGLSWYDMLGIVDTLAGFGRVVGADITELLPGTQERRSAFLAARLLAYMLPRFCQPLER